MASKRELLFEEVCSQDFLQFKFGERGYQDQLNDSIAKTNALAAVKVELVEIPVGDEKTQTVVWVAHNFGFLGGSLGCAEGEKITRAFEIALERKLPICVQCRSGGARMQEGTSSLMQMAKVAVAVKALSNASLPFISVLSDPTYGGVSASYAMQADVRIAISEEDEETKEISEARIGFAGPAVILNTMCEANQALFDQQCPNDFQAASFVLNSGQVDMVLKISRKGKDVSAVQKAIEAKVGKIANMMVERRHPSSSPEIMQLVGETLRFVEEGPEDNEKAAEKFNYTRSRLIDRPQTQDIINQAFDNFVELSGDGKVGKDACLRGGIATFHGVSCVVIATFKGHTPTDMQAANYGMPSPHGYRTALRLMQMAEKFGLPVVTLVDTVGAWPTFACERDGQSEAIATNLTAMAGLRVPIITLMVGEGGSGGALGICMGNTIAMLSGGYFGVISPEGAASILGRYKDDKHKAEQFPKDCQALATAQCIYAHQLKSLGVVDYIIWEETDLVNAKETDSAQHVLQLESFKNFPKLLSRIEKYIAVSLMQLSEWSAEKLVEQRYQKYRELGTFALMNEEERQQAIQRAKEAAASSTTKRVARVAQEQLKPTLLLKHLAEETVTGGMSKYRKLAPSNMSVPLKSSDSNLTLDKKPIETSQIPAPKVQFTKENVDPETCRSAKAILDAYGVEYLCRTWLPAQAKKAKRRVLVTDTTMRDAHQSLLATRVRTVDIIAGAKIASELLGDAFSLECWGGATFDVCMRFLDECPWDRLRQIREACPNICLQMLIRGANGVGYTSYPDNVVREFVHLAAKNGMDVFRIFDCFNVVENMRVSIEAVRETGKVAEVCICYTGNILSSEIYNREYYRNLAAEIKAVGCDILAIKDMAGLLRPFEVEPLMAELRAVVGDEIPIHFHTHATSSGSLATCIEMAKFGCNIIDCCTASMADGTSQPSLNTFLAMMEGSENMETGINYLTLEKYDLYWAAIRDQYSPFESGMKSGTARVFEHQIPGGQYSNLLVQCAGMGLQLDQWSAVLDAYRDVNLFFGDIVKVTPSSKCVGDLALYLVMKGLKTSDLIDPVTNEILPAATYIDWPQSVVGLVKGELGFPHRGFPKHVEDLILKGANKLTVRAGLVLPPVDFAENIQKLSEKWRQSISAEEAMSSLMYPAVFNDYMARKEKKGPLLQYLPTPVYFYALNAGDVFDMHVPTTKHLFHVFAGHAALQTAMEKSSVREEELLTVRVELQRVGPIMRSHRANVFKLSLIVGDVANNSVRVVFTETQQVDVKDTGGAFVFEGPMADPNKPLKEVASPMAGVVEKILVQEGQTVKAGDVLFLVSAMKMEVKVSAPADGVIQSVAVPNPGYRVVEGALLLSLV